MTPTELRQKTLEELKQLHVKMTSDLKDLALEFVRGKEKNSQKIRGIRKNTAQILTVINEKTFLQK